jgi:hypothetical protein
MQSLAKFLALLCLAPHGATIPTQAYVAMASANYWIPLCRDLRGRHDGLQCLERRQPKSAGVLHFHTTTI